MQTKKVHQESSLIKPFLLRCEKVFLECKGIGMLFFVPILVDYVLLGLAVFAGSLAGYALDYAYSGECFKYIPIMAPWWMLMTFREYVEGEGHELLFLHDKGKVWDMVLLFLLYLVMWFPLWKLFEVIWCQDTLGAESAVTFFVMLFVRCLFYYGTAFALLVLTKQLTFPFLFVLVYAIFSNNLYHVKSKLILFLFAPSDLAFFMGGLLGIIIGCVGMKKMSAS